MKDVILAKLPEIERDNDVKLLLAVESGSRAWGFPSADSDYDVRFIYVRRPEWYLSIDVERKRDVIELPINDVLDISGWDLRKALQLFRKSNPPLLEWLGSPIVYLEQFTVAQQMRDLAPTAYSPIACMYHYYKMARGNYRDYLRGDVVRTKKYFYVLRPVLGVLWLERQLGVVPTEFQKLVDGVITDPALKTAIDTLIAEKRQGFESAEGPRIDIISDFLDAEIQRLEDNDFAKHVGSPDSEQLDALFRAALAEVWA